jgi:threonine dehydratase
MVLPTLEEIQSAAALIAKQIPATPCLRWDLPEAGVELWLKHENLTPAGAFKVRGGLVYLHELMKAEPAVPGVIAASTGNHGRSIASAAKQCGLRAVIVVPRGNNPAKNAAIRALGAELVEQGREFQDALEFSRELAQREGLHAVPSFHPWLVRGVATYALELFQAAPPLDAVFVPIGLGSGFCGLAAVKAALHLDAELIGVVSEHAPAYAMSFHERRFIEVPSLTQVAEGVACRKPNPEALELVQAHAADVLTVNDEEAKQAMRRLTEITGQPVEGSAAITVAALLKHQERWAGKRVACILSGGNV